VVIRGGEAILKGEGVEEDEAADAQGGGAVFFLVGPGDDVGDAAGYALVPSDVTGGLFERMTDHAGSGGHVVDALQFQR